MNSSSPPRFAIIAGNGQFPFLALDGARAQGVDPVVFAIREEASPQLSEYAKKIYWLSLGEIARLMELLGAEGVEKVVLAGQVKHAQLFRGIVADPMARGALNGLPSRNTDALIGAFVQMLEAAGIEVADSTVFLKPLLAGAGTLTRRAPAPDELADVEYGQAVARQIATLDIGQTVVVADRACVAIEAMEGTDATIERAASLANGRRLVVVKVSKPRQDMRFDVPVIGAKTIDVMQRSGATALALDAGKALLFERDRLLSRANEVGITIVGMSEVAAIG